FQAEDGIRDATVTGVQTCALPISDINLYKDTKITERVNFQFRFEVFNLFNRANLTNVDTNYDDRVGVGNGNFGLATNSHLPRWRSEERRVGKECKIGRSTETRKKK